MSSEEHTKLTVVDGRDALASVLIRPGHSDGHVALEAWAKGIDKPRAAHVLRHVADMWGPRIGLAGVLDEVAAERARQDATFGEQNHPDGTGQYPETIDANVAKMVCEQAAEGGYLDWLHILREEVAEAFAETAPARLRAELVQVAAVAVAWVQAIDRRTGALPALLQAVAEQLPADDPDRAAEGLARMPLPADGSQS